MSIFGVGIGTILLDYFAYIPHPVTGANANDCTQ